MYFVIFKEHIPDIALQVINISVRHGIGCPIEFVRLKEAKRHCFKSRAESGFRGEGDRSVEERETGRREKRRRESVIEGPSKIDYNGVREELLKRKTLCGIRAQQMTDDGEEMW